MTTTDFVALYVQAVIDHAAKLVGGNVASRTAAADAIRAAFRAVPGIHRQRAQNDAVSAAIGASLSAARLTALVELHNAMQAEKSANQTRRRDENIAPALGIAALTIALRIVRQGADKLDNADAIAAYAFAAVDAYDTPAKKRTSAQRATAESVGNVVAKLADNLTPSGSKSARDVTLADLIGAGTIAVGEKLSVTTDGKTHTAVVTADGKVTRMVNGKPQKAQSLSAAGCAVKSVKSGINGWTFWRVSDGRTVDAVAKSA